MVRCVDVLPLPCSDSPPHVPPGELSTDMVIQVIANMTQTIRQNFPNLPVYPALGNHDYWPQVASPLLGYWCVETLLLEWLCFSLGSDARLHQRHLQSGCRAVETLAAAWCSAHTLTRWLMLTLVELMLTFLGDVWSLWLRLQVASTASRWNLVCGWSVWTPFSIMDQTRLRVTWRTLQASMTGWRRRCWMLPRAWRRLDESTPSAASPNESFLTCITCTCRCISSATCLWDTCPSPGTSPLSESTTTRGCLPSSGSTVMSSRANFMATPTVTALWCCWTSKVKHFWSRVFNLGKLALDLDDRIIYEIKMCFFLLKV